VVLPHQHSRGDSRSLCDSLCRTDKNRFYSTGIYVAPEPHSFLTHADNAGDAGIAHRDRDTVVKGTRGAGDAGAVG
jgi:hypothetical protein